MPIIWILTGALVYSFSWRWEKPHRHTHVWSHPCIYLKLPSHTKTVQSLNPSPDGITNLITALFYALITSSVPNG